MKKIEFRHDFGHCTKNRNWFKKKVGNKGVSSLKNTVFCLFRQKTAPFETQFSNEK